MQLQLDYLDTGQLYRAVSHLALSKGSDLKSFNPTELVEIAKKLDLSQPFEEGLRTSEVGKAASKVAAFAEVRHALLHKQRNFAKHPLIKMGRFWMVEISVLLSCLRPMPNFILMQRQISG